MPDTGGQPTSAQKYPFAITVRFSADQMADLKKEFGQSGEKQLSTWMRNVVLGSVKNQIPREMLFLIEENLTTQEFIYASLTSIASQFKGAAMANHSDLIRIARDRAKTIVAKWIAEKKRQ